MKKLIVGFVSAIVLSLGLIGNTQAATMETVTIDIKGQG